ncbi:alpha/beta hydrolase [Streptococcus ovuberis]|uniref:alpha/beta hydrolase n=1 Tax=Streptococcus ovuberis TaxID=1936207 RepID=UPI001FE6B09B|nr:alpha/beta hydrolase [Streptococcus ovuberis]
MVSTYTFELNDKVVRTSVRFKNRYGIELAGDLYQPKNAQGKLPALPVSGAFGAVKEQTAGFYANELASRGFITLAFDPSFTGESGGESRNVASPDIFTEDYSAAVDFLGTLEQVDRNRIGLMAICGLSGMALTAATNDVRVKAVATASMYDMSRSIAKGYKDGYTLEERQKIRQYLAQQRWSDVDTGRYATGPHEISFDEAGEVIVSQILPDVIPDALKDNQVLVAFHNYYKTERGYHERSVNSTGAWTATTPQAFFNFPLLLSWSNQSF